MRFFLPFILAAGLLVTTPTAEAQVADGLRELNASGAFTVTSGDIVVNTQGFLGFFLTDAIEVGPLVNLTITENVSLVNLGGFAAYHFTAPGATSVPFVGAELTAGLADAEGFVVGGLAGLKYFVAEGAAIVPSAFVRIPDEGDVSLGAQFGISIFF